MRILTHAILAAAAFSQPAFSQPAFAQAVATETATNVGGPEWARPFADGSCCSGLGPVRYATQDFYVDATGSYDISSAQGGFDGYIFVYLRAFDPTQQTLNFVAGDDDGNGGIGTSDIEGLTLDANTTYILVSTGFANGDEGEFVNTISGFGNAYFYAYVAPQLQHLAAAAGMAGRIVLVDAARIAGTHGQASLAARGAGPSFTSSRGSLNSDAPARVSTQGTVNPLYTWAEFSGFRAEDSSANRDYDGRGFQLGADIALSPNMVAGASAGIQKINASSTGFRHEGELHFFQPYLAYARGPWSAEASVINGYGELSETSAAGKGDADTRLKAFSLSASYHHALNARTTLSPTVGFTRGVVDIEGKGGTLAGTGTHTVRFTEATLGGEVRYAFAGGDAYFGVHADHTKNGADSALVSSLLADDGWTGRVEMGVSKAVGQNVSLDTSVKYSGMGGDLRQVSGSLAIAFSF